MLTDGQRRRRFRRARSTLRASIEITRDQRQPELFGYSSRLAHAPLGLPKGWLTGLAPTEMNEGAEWCLRQALWQHARQQLGSLCEVLRFVNGETGPFFAPLPGAWRRELNRFGMKLENLRSFAAFLSFQAREFLSGLRRIAHYLRLSRTFGRPNGRYAVLYFVRDFNLPPRDCPRPHWDWVTSTRQLGLVDHGTKLWAVSLSGGDIASSGINVVPNPMPALRGWRNMAAFVLSASLVVAVSALRWATGSWWAPVMLREFIDLAYARQIDGADFASAYFFPPQFMSRRPLWSWWVERLGSDVVLEFYSHNFQTTYLLDKPDARLTDVTYSLMRWHKVVYITKECGPYMEAVGAARHQHIVAGMVSLVDQGGMPPVIDGPAIAVFDIDPVSPARRATAGMPQHWHSRAVVRAFLDEVSAAIREAGATPVWKLKGTIFEEEAFVPEALRYDHLAHQEIAKKHGAVVCSDRLPVQRLAGAVDAALVLPFTTPATLFRMLGRPAAYYDPTGTLGAHALMARGAPILADPHALRTWLKDVLRQSLERKRISA